MLSSHQTRDLECFADSSNIPWNPPTILCPCVGIVIDQRSDGWSACCMLDSWGCNIMGLHVHPNHSIWNHCMLGIRDAGLYSWVLVTLAVIGLDHGPSSTARWWAELKAGTQEYISISPSDCHTFSELWASIACRRGHCGARPVREEARLQGVGQCGRVEIRACRHGSLVWLC